MAVVAKLKCSGVDLRAFAFVMKHVCRKPSEVSNKLSWAPG
jgi:hypothetical protein